jgi:hypothetical protein
VRDGLADQVEGFRCLGRPILRTRS